jgi:hypothetical protein
MLNMILVVSKLLLSVLVVAVDVLKLSFGSQFLLLVAKSASGVHGGALGL